MRNIIAQKLISYAIAIFSSALVSGCGIWRPYDGFKDPPYAKGQLVEAQHKINQCHWCKSGGYGDSAYFPKENCSNGMSSSSQMYDIEKIFKDADKLLAQAIPKEKWIFTRKTFVGTDRYFYPARVFIPSIDPLTLIIIPWDKYDLKRILDHSSHILDITQKYYEFEYIDKSKSNLQKRIVIGWPSELFIPLEVRGSLPVIPEQLRVIAKGFDKTITIPAVHKNQEFTLDVADQKIKFTPSGEKLNIAFTSKGINCR